MSSSALPVGAASAAGKKRRGEAVTASAQGKDRLTTARYQAHELSFSHIARLVLLGVLFHSVYILSIFDIYFRSPLVTGLEHVPPLVPVPARRLVLFVGDGLRADKCFHRDSPTGKPLAPFLRERALKDGIWGVSHTRVPTESRPGHIAMIAGFYEDVSAVTQGWKKNTVPFDHLLARASHAWSFGAPEIVDLFLGPAVTGSHYAEHMIDFAKDGQLLDQWSFDRLAELLLHASTDPQLHAKLSGENVMIFVHLLGLDTNGHAFGPHSQEYLENVRFVDKGVERAVAQLEEFFGHDGKTAYVFTADHGMSDLGTHGDGDPDNTRTPLIAWGAGVARPARVSVAAPQQDPEGFAQLWGLDQVQRRDVAQADLTPFMASLLGVSIPSNSEGVLSPELLDLTPQQKAMAMQNNFRQILRSYEAKERRRALAEPYFKPHVHSAADILNGPLQNIASLISDGSFADAVVAARSGIEMVFAGLDYLQKYDWRFLRGTITVGYLSWMLYAMIYLVRHSAYFVVRDGHKVPSLFAKLTFIGLAAPVVVWLALKSAPAQYYLYVGFPLFFLYSTFQQLHQFGIQPYTKAIGGFWHRLSGLLVYLGGLELFVISYYHRWTLGLVCPIVALVSSRLVSRGAGRLACALVFLVYLGIAVFPALSPIKTPDLPLFLSGVAATILLSLLMVALDRHRVNSLMLIAVRMAVLVLATYTAYDSDRLFAAKLGLPWTNQLTAWILLAYSLISVGICQSGAPQRPLDRLVDIFLSIAPAYAILSVSYEMLFFAALAAPLFLWIYLRQRQSIDSSVDTKGKTDEAPAPLDPIMLFLSFKFLLYLHLAFFGTGNIASISSFALPSVYRLVTIFAPFLMGSLLLSKLAIPVVVLAAMMGVVVRLVKISSYSIFLLVLATFDVCTMTFFFLVRDQGSWLEIGMSISHFILASLFSLMVLMMLGLSKVLLRGVVFP